MTQLTFPIRSNKLAYSVMATRTIAKRKTPFQEIEIVDTEAFGKVLFLDGHVQLSSLDEFAYHESLVHIPLLSIDHPKRALVIGGGDGGVIREIVKHESMQNVHMVDIDSGVIEVCKEHLPELSAGAFDHPKVTLYIEDAFEFIKRVDEPYDLIVMDVTDVYEDEEGELSEQLFTETFYRDCLAALSPEGMIVTQADNHVFCPYSMEEVLANFGSVFPVLGSYQAIVPSFGGFSGFVWASKGAHVAAKFPKAKAQALGLRYLNETTYDLALIGKDPGGQFPPVN